MWIETIKASMAGDGLIVAEDHSVMRELQAERERTCICNQPRPSLEERYAHRADGRFGYSADTKSGN